MKRFLVLILELVLAFLTVPAHASGVAPSAHAAFPAGFSPLEIRRWMRDDHVTWDIVTAPPNLYSPPWNVGGPLGWISYTPFPGSHPLYVCQRLRSQDLFTSSREHCEGERRVPMPYVLGHVASTQIPGTVPLYRCVAGRNEFDSVHAHCEGQGRVGILGFVFPP